MAALQQGHSPDLFVFTFFLLIFLSLQRSNVISSTTDSVDGKTAGLEDSQRIQVVIICIHLTVNKPQEKTNTIDDHTVSVAYSSLPKNI